MAKVNFGTLAADVRGKIGGIVYSRNTAGAYVRTKVTPINANTIWQQTVRSNMSAISKAWQGLTKALQTQWTNFATSHPVSNVFGNKVTIPGIAMFNRINGILLNINEPIMTAVPEDTLVTDISIVSVVLTAATREFNLDFLPDPTPADHHIAIEVTKPISAGQNYYANLLRFAAYSTAAVASPFKPILDAARFPLIAGQVIGYRVYMINDANGAKSIGTTGTTVAA